MASIQERLQMKRVPLDTWSTREQLCLASSVVRSGDQNWMSVSRALKSLGDPSRPADWFSQKNCAIQYGSLLEHVETPKRKKRTTEGVAETPQESILKKLTQERIAELQKLMTEASHNYAKIKEEVKELLSYDNTPTSEVRLRAMGTALETERRGREREAAKRAHWLKEREERRALLERAWRRPDTESPHPSPLLTSLLQSPAPMHHIPTPEATSPSSGAPTLSLLLEKSTPPILTPSDEPPLLTPISKKKVSKKSELQLIEKIKSDLVQELEQKFNGGAMPSESNMLGIIPTLHNPSTPAMHSVKDAPNENPKSADKGDFYDIEFKQEDVYAFSDIDLDIPPVSSMHKSSLGRALHADKNLFNKRELASNISSLDDVASPPAADSEVLNSLLSLLSPAENLNPEAAIAIENVNEAGQIGDVNLRMDEIAAVTSSTNESDNPAQSYDSKENILTEIQIQNQLIDIKVENPEPTGEEEDSDGEMNQKVSDLKKDLEAKKSHENLYLPESEEGFQKPVEAATLHTNTQEFEKLDSKNNQELVEKQSTAPVQVTTEQNATVGNAEIYDDTPIEVIKEDKPGKTKRDYSRKKTEKDDRAPSPPSEVEGVVSNKSECSDEIGSDNSQGSADKKVLSRRFRNEVSGSRSESPATPLDSLPGSPAPPSTPPLIALNSSLAPSTSTPSNPSPAPTEQEREHRLWKKSIILAYNRLNTLKYASLFHRPITDDQAPGYSEAVRKPIDLSTIRRNIDQGSIRTTSEFQHDVLLMFSNALMYNRTDHRVYTMAQDTMRDACQQLDLLLQAQGYATNQNMGMGLGLSTSRGARPLRPLVPSAGSATATKRKRGGGASSGDTPASKKRKPDDV